MIPPLAILPILFIVFGLGEVSKVALIVHGHRAGHHPGHLPSASRRNPRANRSSRPKRSVPAPGW